MGFSSLYQNQKAEIDLDLVLGDRAAEAAQLV